MRLKGTPRAHFGNLFPIFSSCAPKVSLRDAVLLYSFFMYAIYIKVDLVEKFGRAISWRGTANIDQTR